MDQDAYTIEQFCLNNGISKGLFFKLKRAGRGPREMDVGEPGSERPHPLISREAAREWRAKIEGETAAAKAANTDNTPT